MALIKLSPFGGLIPRTGTRLLPDSAATVATNVKLQSGELRPLRNTKRVNTPNKPLPAKSIFIARNGEESAWFTWPFDVDVVRVPFASEVESRFVWTGDGVPRLATYSLATSSGNNDYPFGSFALGVPYPLGRPTVTPDGSGTGAATTRIYTYTFFTALGEESAPAPASDLATGKVDDVWAISGMDALPANSGAIVDVTFVGKVVTIETDITPFNRVGDEIEIVGVTTVSDVEGVWTLTAVDTTAKTMTFSVTDTPVGTFDALTDTAASWTRSVPWNVSGMKRRLYRSTGLLGTVQLVDDDVSTSYNDTISDALILGDELISSGWLPPPVGLKGVKVHSSGSLVGFVGNQVCFSEPLQPHAWPESYRLSTDRDIVAIGVFDSYVGVTTKGSPWVASGTEPASMSFERIAGLYPCLSKRSLTPYNNGLLYSSSQGLLFVGAGGVSIVTEALYTRDEWAELNPSSMICAVANGRVYVSFQREDASRAMLVLDEGALVASSVQAFALYADDATNELFIASSGGVAAWDAPDSYPLQTSWRSKEFVFPAPVNLGAAKVEFDAAIDEASREAILAEIAEIEVANAALLLTGDAHGAINAFGFNSTGVHGSAFQKVPVEPPVNEVLFILRRDGEELVLSRVVRSNKAFRLPAGYKTDNISIEVLSQTRVREVRVAETMDGLRVA